MKVRKLLAFVLAVCMTACFPMLSSSAMAEDSGTAETENERVQDITAEGRCLAFASDLHGLENVLETALAGFPENTEYLSIIGDLVGERGGDAPGYNAIDVYERAHAIMDWIKTDQFSIIWADHDKNVSNQKDIVKCMGGYISEQIYEGKNSDGSAAYYIYGVGFYHMTDGGSVSQEAAESFKEWVKSKDENVPVIVLCHVPLQAVRGDNLGASYWNEALNYAATGVEGITTVDDTAEITRNVLYLYGHNHTSDKTEYLFRAGTDMCIQIDTGKASGLYSEAYYNEAGENIETTEAGDEEYSDLLAKKASAKAQGIVSNIYYTAMIPGYLKTSGNASLVSITDSVIRIAKYKNGEEVSLGTDGSTGEILGSSIDVERIVWGEPEYTWSDDLSSVTATRVCKNTPSLVQKETVTTSSEVISEPSCEETGERTYRAVFENPAFQTQTKVQAIPAYGHDWQEWVVTKEATATEDGEMTRICSRDSSHVEIRTIPATGEDETASVTGSAADDSETPDTGDNSAIGRWVTLMMLAGALLAGVILYKRRNK